MVLTILGWRKRSEVKAIEVFGGAQIRKLVTKLFSIVRQKSRAKFLLPWEDNWDKLLFELTLLLLNEELVSQLILGSELHWGEQELSRIWELGAESNILLNDLETTRKTFDRDWMLKTANACGFKIPHASRDFFVTDSFQASRTVRLIGCMPKCFQEFNKRELLPSQLLEPSENKDMKVRLQSSLENTNIELIDVHPETDRFLKIHVLSDGSTHYLLGITEDIYDVPPNTAISLKEGSLIPKTSVIFDSSFHRSLFRDEAIQESLFRFCDRLNLRGLHSIEFVLKRSENNSIYSGSLIYHGMNSLVMEEIWLLGHHYKQHLLQLHEECLEGNHITKLDSKGHCCLSLVNLYAMNSFRFYANDWKRVNFFERPVDEVTVPRGIHWGTVVLEGQSMNDLRQKISLFLTSLNSR